MSQHFLSLKVGDSIDIKGPCGRFQYLGRGVYSIRAQKKSPIRRIGMIAGGSGITPMYQIMKAILHNKSDKTKVSLIYANQTPSDILLREEFDRFSEISTQFSIWFTVDRDAPPGWEYDTGFVSAAMISKHLPPPDPETLILMCGPLPMIEYACKPNLKQLDYNEELCWTF